MSRAPFQVLVLPFRRAAEGGFEFACLRRADDGSWQGVAGGGEDGETPEAAARREAREEADIPAGAPLYRLRARAEIPAAIFAASRFWPADLATIPEYAFAVDVTGIPLRLSHEHTALRWGKHGDIRERLRWESNRAALDELRERLEGGRMEEALVFT